MTTRDGRVLRTVKVVDHGDPAARFDLVVLSEGYTQADLDAGVFEADVDGLVAAIFAAEPFDDPVLQQAINVWRIDVASTESGADSTTRTYFDATSCADGRVRRLLGVNTATVLTVVDDRVPEWDVAMVIVNTTVRGGSGGTGVPVLSKSSDLHDVALHELGHAAFGLADEYEFRAGCQADGTALECRMRRSDRQFCPVCSEHIRQTLRPYVPGRRSPMDLTVVTSVRDAVGDEPGSLPAAVGPPWSDPTRRPAGGPVRDCR